MGDGILHFLGAWGAFGIVASLFLVFAIFFTYYYADPSDREPFAMGVTVLALTLCLTAVALFPVDIYFVSMITDPKTGVRNEWATEEAIGEMQTAVRLVYYVAYGAMASFIFVWIPLAYFYFEELEEDQAWWKRLAASFRYTVFFILVALTLLLTGLVMTAGGRGDSEDPRTGGEDGPDWDWVRKLLAELDATAALAFVAGVLSLVGMSILVLYTAPGLSLLPLHLLAGMKSVSSKLSHQTMADLALNRDRQNAILNRYSRIGGLAAGRGGGGGGVGDVVRSSALSDRDRHALQELAQEEMILENRSRIVQGVRESWFSRCWCIIRPFQIVLGLAGTALTVLLVISVAMTSLDHITDEICGGPCRTIRERNNLPNPLNLLFTRLSPYFPIDYSLMVMLILYMFWATTKGIISLGIRFLWVELYQFRPAATQPQGLLAATMLLMFSLAGLCYSLTMSVAPEYSMFGSQKYCNRTLGADSLSQLVLPMLAPPTRNHHSLLATFATTANGGASGGGNSRSRSSVERMFQVRDCTQFPDLIVPCHVGAPKDSFCTQTVTSTMIHRIVEATPSLGVAFSYMEWLFLVMFLLSFLFNLVQGCRRGFGIDPVRGADEVEDLDELETRGLLEAMNHRGTSGGLDGAGGDRAGRRRVLGGGGGGLLIPGGGVGGQGRHPPYGGYGALKTGAGGSPNTAATGSSFGRG